MLKFFQLVLILSTVIAFLLCLDSIEVNTATKEVILLRGYVDEQCIISQYMVIATTIVYDQLIMRYSVAEN